MFCVGVIDFCCLFVLFFAAVFDVNMRVESQRLPEKAGLSTKTTDQT